MEYTFSRITVDDINWSKIEGAGDSTIYKTSAWFNYLYHWKKLRPFIVEVATDCVIGYFVGELINKGIKIIGSPFVGLGTAHQGLSTLSQISSQERLSIYSQLAKWVFENKLAHFIQVEDWNLSMSDMKESNIIYEGHDGYMIDLSQSEEQIFKNMHQKSCRYSINKSKKLGICIRETHDVDRFVDVYYDQLLEVFKKQGLVPTYDKSCVKSLVDSLYPEHMLLLEAVTPDGAIAATGLFPGEKNIAIFWGGASYQKYQNLCPNEPLIWEAIRMWKSRGTKVFDLCGIRPYKLKFGPVLYTKPRLIFAQHTILISLKKLIKKIYYGCRNIGAGFKK